MNSSYCLSNLTMAAALASMNDAQHRAMCKQKNDQVKEYTYNELTKLKYRVIPSSTNFMFFNLKDYPGDFAVDMAKKNILLRYNQYPDGKWCRVSLGTMDEMQQFIRIMHRSEVIKYICSTNKIIKDYKRSPLHFTELMIFCTNVVNEIRLQTLLPDKHLHLCAVMDGMVIQLKRNIQQSRRPTSSIITGEFNFFVQIFFVL